MGNVPSNIKLKRVYDPREPSDGYRLLATRYWPRGVHRDATDEYISMLAPSRQLIKEYKKGPLEWAEFERRYAEELNDPTKQAELLRLARMAATKIITLLCFCEDERDCHRTLLRRAIIASADTDLEHG